MTLLSDAGEALYGPRWQTAIAGALGISSRQVRRWVAGEGSPPQGVYSDLLRMVIERRSNLVQIEMRLWEMG